MTKRFVVDASWRRIASERIVIAGSPLKVFRITEAGEAIIDALEQGRPLPNGHEPLTTRLEAAGAIHPVHNNFVDASDIEVVIPAYITNADAARNLQLLVDVLQPLQITVVDDASPVKVQCSGATVIRHDHNQGPAAARNTGARAASSPYIAFVDTDCVASSDDIRAVAAHFSAPHVGLVAPRVAAIEDDSAISLFESFASPLDMGTEPANVMAMSRVSYVPSAVLLVRNETFKELGGFKESHRFGEDVDFVWRSIDHGWQCRYDPYIVCLHRNRASWRELAKQRMSYGEAAATLYLGHPNRLAPLHSDAATALSVTCTAIGMPLFAISSTAISTSVLWKELQHVGIPATHIARLTVDRWLHTANMISHAVTRVWWPLVALAAIFSHRARKLLVLSLVFPLLYQQLPNQNRNGAAQSIPWGRIPLAIFGRIIDHGGYSVGVWRGMWRKRTVGPLLPKISVKRSSSN
jgi:mycofactocin glycosyltransferase